jgi:hypothetical protein
MLLPPFSLFLSLKYRIRVYSVFYIPCVQIVNVASNMICAKISPVQDVNYVSLNLFNKYILKDVGLLSLYSDKGGHHFLFYGSTIFTRSSLYILFII